MSISHYAYQIDQRIIKWAKDIQRRKKDKSDVMALMLKEDNNPLTADQKKAIAAFWKPYGKTDPIYQKYFYEKNGIFDIKYIPDDLYYTQIQYYYNNIPAAKIVDHKGYYEALFPDIQHPVIIARRLNGYWIVDNKCIHFDRVCTLLIKEKTVFIKPATITCGGKGIVVLEGDKVTQKDIKEAVDSIKGDIVIQKEVEQCAELKKLNPNSVNTMRIMTLLDKEGNVVILSRSLRMGTGNSRLDNAHSGGISIGFSEDGRLKDFALALDGKRFYSHPNSGIVFKDYKIPESGLIDETVKKCALRIPAFRIVAWDISLDITYKPIMIETNLFNAGMDVPQLNNGPLFGDRTEEYLNEVYGKSSTFFN